MSDFATITRNPQDKIATLTVRGVGPWALFAGEDASRIDYSRPLASGAGPAALRLPGITGWTCFALRAGGTVLYLAERLLPMAGGYNFRDLGGFTGAEGRQVAWGKLFRTDGLGALTDGDLAYLASIPIKTVIDFRTGDEAGRTPDKIPATVANIFPLPLAPGYLNPAAGKDVRDAAGSDAFMLRMYQELALDPAITATYRQFFSHVQNGGDIPLLFHCSAGKDRTGVAAALILLALGVDRETVLADYEMSNTYLGDKYASIIREKPHLLGLFTVKRVFLEEALRLIVSAYGSVTRYLETALAVDIAAMRRLFLI